MSKTSSLLSPLESLQMAWAIKLRDFKQWCQPTTQAVYNWKQRKLSTALTVAKTTMADDVEKMLKAVAEKDNAGEIGNKKEKGTSAYLPVLVTAISPIEMPPEREDVIGVSTWQNVVIDTDPLQRVVQMRTMAVAYRCQIAFFAPDPHSCSSVVNQFINFWKHEGKRTFPVSYHVGFAGDDIVKNDWDFRVLDNSLSADSADVGLENIYVATVDCTIVGAEPTVVGLGGQWDDSTDTGEPIDTLPTDPKGGKPIDPSDPNSPLRPIKPLIPPIKGRRIPKDKLGKFVIEADIYTNDEPTRTRVTIDKESKVITQKELKN